MALITCPECGGKVSDKAEACIHCGFPLKQMTHNNAYYSIKLIKFDTKTRGTINSQIYYEYSQKELPLFFRLQELYRAILAPDSQKKMQNGFETNLKEDEQP